MRIVGRDLKQVVLDVVPIFRGEEQINIKIQSVRIGEEFEQLCLRPEPPTIVKKDGTKSQDTKNKDYTDKFMDWAKKRHDYMVIKSLQCNDDLQWDLVNMQDPSTWEMWTTEMEESGLTVQEINLIVEKILDLNSINEAKVEEARKSFLADLQAQQAE